MILGETVHRFILWRQSHGTKFEGGARILRRFLKGVDAEAPCDAVTRDAVRVFLAGTRPLTSYRTKKYSVLSGLYCFAIIRGYATRSPLPGRESEPKAPAPLPPYIYTGEEIRRLLKAVDVSRARARQLDADTLGTLILLLHGTGLRCGEALRLTLADVDLDDAVLTVRESKFYKSRLVPVGKRLAHVLRDHAVKRLRRPQPQGRDATFLANRDGTPLTTGVVRNVFAKLLRDAGVGGGDSRRRGPCLHSFRHGFAVGRLDAWYRQGADVQRLLPVLSTYLGHKNPTGTQVYLSMTPERLHQASLRYECYMKGDEHA